MDVVYYVTVTIVHNNKKEKRKELVIQIRKKNVYVHIIMFQSFIRHARVMNNFFVTSTDHLSLPLHFPRSLDGFGVLTSLWPVVDYSTVTNTLLFYLHNFRQTDTHDIIHYTYFAQINIIFDDRVYLLLVITLTL